MAHNRSDCHASFVKFDVVDVVMYTHGVSPVVVFANVDPASKRSATFGGGCPLP
jgi:hypothetical protein